MYCWHPVIFQNFVKLWKSSIKFFFIEGLLSMKEFSTYSFCGKKKYYLPSATNNSPISGPHRAHSCLPLTSGLVLLCCDHWWLCTVSGRHSVGAIPIPWHLESGLRSTDISNKLKLSAYSPQIPLLLIQIPQMPLIILCYSSGEQRLWQKGNWREEWSLS